MEYGYDGIRSLMRDDNHSALITANLRELEAMTIRQ